MWTVRQRWWLRRQGRGNVIFFGFCPIAASHYVTHSCTHTYAYIQTHKCRHNHFTNHWGGYRGLFITRQTSSHSYCYINRFCKSPRPQKPFKLIHNILWSKHNSLLRFSVFPVGICVFRQTTFSWPKQIFRPLLKTHKNTTDPLFSSPAMYARSLQSLCNITHCVSYQFHWNHFPLIFLCSLCTFLNPDIFNRFSFFQLKQPKTNWSILKFQDVTLTTFDTSDEILPTQSAVRHQPTSWTSSLVWNSYLREIGR